MKPADQREEDTMKATIEPPTRRRSFVRCAVCETHSRPLYVPWQQHAIGCTIRTSALRQRELDPPAVDAQQVFAV